MTTTCLLADDHPALTWTLAEYLTANGFEVVGPVGDGRQAVAVASSDRSWVVAPEAAVQMPVLTAYLRGAGRRCGAWACAAACRRASRG